MEIRKTKQRVQLVKGQPVPKNIYDEKGELLIAKGTILENLDDPELQDMDIEVTDKIRGKLDDDFIKLKLSPFEIINKLQLRLRDLYNNFYNFDDIKPRIYEFCKIIQRMCYEDTDAALATIMIDDFKQYSIKQTIRAAIVCEVISRHLGWPDDERTILVSAALTMNLSMSDLQDKLNSYSQALDDAQKKEIKNHPQKSVLMLKQKGVMNKVWLDTIIQHHENPNGTGYPMGLKRNEIIPSARLLSLSDIYCARVTGREYRKGLKPNSAMREIFLSGNQGTEEDFAMVFIKVLGIFPPGTFVKLANHDTAIVSHRGDTANAPIAFSIVTPDGNRIYNPVQRDCSVKEYAITKILSIQEANIDVNRHQIWGYGMYDRPKLRSKKKVKPFREKRRITINAPSKLLDIETAATFDAFLIDISETGCLLKTSIKEGKDIKEKNKYYIFFKAA
ncbi:MAG: hypothetical protein HQK91_12700, partial [Nitrospirae bacterium]|nr:hypothetical protein [Nitrospirota bacterium]